MNADIVERLLSVHGASPEILRAEVVSFDSDGTINVRCGRGTIFRCEVLEGAFPDPTSVCEGDHLVVIASTETALGCVIGRIGRFNPAVSHKTVEASEALTLKCGAASIELRADGKVMIRGEDVLIRAKGTQRIRAGTVSIN